MKKTIMLLPMVILVTFAFSQVVSVPALPLRYEKDTFVVTIKNDDTASTSFYPLTVFDEPGTYRFINSESYYEYLREEGTAIGALRAHAKVVKSPRFVNGWIESSDFWPTGGGLNRALVEKRYSTIGFLLGSPAYKCGHYRTFASQVFVKAGCINPDQVRQLSGNGHQSVEFVIDGDTIGYDSDPGEAYLMSHMDTNDFMSFADMVSYPEKLEAYTYEGEPFALPNPDKYAQKVAGFQHIPTVYAQSPTENTGIITLCAGCELSYQFGMPELVDTSGGGFDTIVSYLQGGQFQMAAIALAEKLNTTPEMVYEKFSQGYALFTSGQLPADLTKTSVYNNPVIRLRVHAQKDIVIGTDLRLPFTVKSVMTTRQIAVGDTMYPVGYSTYVRYNRKSLFDEFPDNEQEPVYAANQFQYLNAGFIPAGTDVEFELYFNNRMYSIPYGMQIETFGNVAPTISVSGGMATSIVSLSYDQAADGRIYSITGQQIATPKGLHIVDRKLKYVE